VSESFFSPEYTFHFNKYSCVRNFYFAHLTFNYLIAISGALAFISRIGPGKFKWTHRWFGRMYIMCMIWSMATSLLIHNTGLPAAVLWSFLWVLGGLCVAWILIVFHMQQMDRAAFELVEKNLAKGDTLFDLSEQVNAAKGKIASSKTWVQRLISFKAAHGILMCMSYVNIIGRVLVTPVSADFTCSTYPVYKPLGMYANQTGFVLVPELDPGYSRTPWSKTGLPGWAALLSLGPLLGALVIGAVWSLIAAKRARQSVNSAHDLGLLYK